MDPHDELSQGENEEPPFEESSNIFENDIESKNAKAHEMHPEDSFPSGASNNQEFIVERNRSDPNVKQLSNVAAHDDPGNDWEWDMLEHEDEYSFANQYITTPKVPKPRRASDDIFYSQPQNIDSFKPGDVIRMREVVPKKYPDNVQAVYQYMVRSTDSLGVAVGIVSTLYISVYANGTQLLSFQVPTDSPCIDCAPSVGMDESMGKLQKPLDYGWNVITPDFQGLRAAFGAGRLAGHAVLDSIRGALRTGHITHIAPSAKAAIWGYSGGSIATGWAAALQPKYAPELSGQLVGAAIGGWITNYDATIRAADGKVTAGLVGMALGGLTEQYRELIPIYKQYISSEGRLRMILEYTKESCLNEGIMLFCGARFFKGRDPYFRGGETVLHDPTVRRIIEENCVARKPEDGIPQCPLFLHHAVGDNIAPFEDTRRAVKNYCDWGIKSFDINYVKNTGHLSESSAGAPAVISWLKERFDGYAPVSGCRETVWRSLKAYPSREDMNADRRKRELFEDDFGSRNADLNDYVEDAQESALKYSLERLLYVPPKNEEPFDLSKSIARLIVPLP